MAKFGELIDIEKPVLIDFFFGKEDADITIEILRDIAIALGDKVRVIKIDVKKNEELATALKVKGNPTFMIYKNGEMQWRKTGVQDANTLINLMQEYI